MAGSSAEALPGEKSKNEASGLDVPRARCGPCLRLTPVCRRECCHYSRLSRMLQSPPSQVTDSTAPKPAVSALPEKGDLRRHDLQINLAWLSRKSIIFRHYSYGVH